VTFFQLQFLLVISSMPFRRSYQVYFMFNSFDDLIKISSPGKILGHGASVPFLDLAILPSLDQI
jgi:hypothetical protein